MERWLQQGRRNLALGFCRQRRRRGAGAAGTGAGQPGPQQAFIGVWSAACCFPAAAIVTESTAGAAGVPRPQDPCAACSTSAVLLGRAQGRVPGLIGRLLARLGRRPVLTYFAYGFE